MNNTPYTKRYICRVVIEAETPLAVGSGEKNFLTDATVALDVNGLPYIPATSIAGVIRHALEQDGKNVDDILGFQEKDKGKGSRVVFSEARILDSKGRVRDGLFDVSTENDPLLNEYFNLPIRQHVRINEKGTHADGGKFDNQVVFAGTRFCFEMEFVLEQEKKNDIQEAIKEILSRDTFRLGSGTRNGLGKVKVISFKEKNLNLLENPDELQAYISKSSCLSDESFWKDIDSISLTPVTNNYTKYVLSLTPRDFFLFGSGYGDTDSDMNAVTESKVVWNKEGTEGHIEEQQTLIPATSIKGALSHRVAFHYNKKKHIYAGSDAAKANFENGSEAVKKLFGYENQKERKQQRGILIFFDMIREKLEGKILNHVAIDRFTGGAIDGALFAERPLYGKDIVRPYEFEIVVTEPINDEDIEYALEQALKDICHGMLPLGGGVNRGNGIFEGILLKDGKEIEV